MVEDNNVIKNILLYIFLSFIPIYGMVSTCKAEQNQTIYPSLFLLNSNSSTSHANALKTMLKKIIAEFEAPGASIAIKFQDGLIFQHAAGAAETTTDKPLTIDAYF